MTLSRTVILVNTQPQITARRSASCLQSLVAGKLRQEDQMSPRAQVSLSNLAKPHKKRREGGSEKKKKSRQTERNQRSQNYTTPSMFTVVYSQQPTGGNNPNPSRDGWMTNGVYACNGRLLSLRRKEILKHAAMYVISEDVKLLC